MKTTFHILCDILPTSDYSKKNYHLPKCLTKNAMHNEYWTEFKDKQEEFGDDYKPYHRTTFAKLWLSDFSYVQIPDHMAFSVCSHCAVLHDRLISATKQRDRATQAKIQTLRKLHLRFVAGERLTYREHQMLARDHPDLYECLCVDGMDQAKLRSPHFAGGSIPKKCVNSENTNMTDKDIEKLANKIADIIFKRQEEYDAQFQIDMEKMSQQDIIYTYTTSSTIDTVSDLESQLKDSIEKEDYKQAAIIAAKIKELKNK